MGQSTVSGPLRSQNGFYSIGTGSVVNVANATNTLTVSPATYAGRVITTNDATLVITLPTIDASGTDSNLGVSYYFFVETAATAWALKTDGTDKFVGSILMVDTDTAGAATGYAPGAANDVINFNGTTTGGIAGSWVQVTAIKALKYMVSGIALGSGTVATPFADS